MSVITIGGDGLLQRFPFRRESLHSVASGGWRNQACVAGLFVALPHLVYAFLWWVPGHRTFGMDYLSCQPGQQLLFMQAVRDGYFPLWAPADGGGVPFAAYIFSGQWSPVTWLLLAVSPLCRWVLGWEPLFEGHQLDILTHVHLFWLSMAGFFTFLVLRRLNVSALSAVFGGVVFMFNFRMLDAFRYASALDVVVWLPVLIYLVERMVVRPSPGLSALYAVIQYVMIVAGHMQEALYCIYFVNLYFVVRAVLFFPKRERLGVTSNWVAARVTCFAGAQTLGFGLCAVMLLPVFEDVMPLWAFRTSPTPQYSSQYHMTWADMAFNLFGPWLADVHSGFYCAQIVWILMAVAAVGLFFRANRAKRHDRIMLMFFFVVLVAGILYALGPLTPLAGAANTCIPFLKVLRCPGRVLSVGMFAMAAIAAFGVNRILHDRHRPALNLCVVGAGCMVYLIIGLVVTAYVPDPPLPSQDKGVSLALLGQVSPYAPLSIQRDSSMLSTMAAMVIAVALANGAVLMFRHLRRLSSSTMIALLLVGVLIEVVVYHGQGTWFAQRRAYTSRSTSFKDIDIYHTRVLHPVRMFVYKKDYVLPPDSGGEIQVHESTPNALRQFLTHGGAPAWRMYYQTVPGHEYARAYITPNVRLVSGGDLEAIAAINPRRTSIIDIADNANGKAAHDASLRKLDDRSEHAEPRLVDARVNELDDSIRVVEYTFNRAVFDVRTSRGGFFNYNDAYATGWQARIDGRETTVYRANHLFKGIVLPPGRHFLEFVYDPVSFRTGLIISLVSVCMIAVLATYSICRRPMARYLIVTAVATFAVPGAWMTYEHVYTMVNRGGLINYDPMQTGAPIHDYEDYFGGDTIRAQSASDG